MGQGLLDIIYELLASPSKALAEISRRKPLGWAILTAAFIAVVLALSFLPNPPELVEVIFDMKKGSFNPALAIILWVIIFLTGLFIEGGIFHLIAILLRGHGSYRGMFCVLCFVCFPFVFFTPLAFMRALLGASGTILYPIGSLALSLWILVLTITAIHQNYHFSLGRAIATYLIPAILLIIVPIFVITIIIPLLFEGRSL